MQRTGLLHVSSMMAVATPAKAAPPDASAAPWNTHWMLSCDHDLVVRLKKYPSGLRAKRQCTKCGQGVGQNVPMAGVTEMWDDELERRVRNEYDSLCEAYRQKSNDFLRAQRGEKSRDWWAMYERYLRSAVWQAKRELVLERCGGVCEACRQAQAHHVHHLKYPDTFGLEPLWDLRGVCIPCHKIIHPHMR